MIRVLGILVVVAIVYKVFFSGPGGESRDFPNRVITETTPVRSVPAGERIRVILFTGTEWCPPCRHLDQSVISTAPWKEFAAGEILFRMVDVPRDRAAVSESDRQLLSRYSPRGFPTMVILDRSGKEVARRSGSGGPVENYKAWIRGYSG